MISQLNPYRNYIDIWTKKGQALASNANDKFISPLLGNDHISLINDSSTAKLSLLKSLQAALMTTAGITEDQFNKIWANACNASGN
jgi:hypothetical protein